MEHCQIRSVLGRSGQIELSLYDEFAPPDDDFKMKARTDMLFETGDFVFTDHTGAPVGYLRCASMSGLVYKISNSLDVAVATVTFHASIFTSKPVHFELELINLNPS